MIVYQSIKSEFLADVDSNRVEERIYTAFQERLRRKTSAAEVSSWRESMSYMYRILIAKDIPNDAGIAIEYNIPQTSKRIDFILSGYGTTGDEVMVIVELKQWTEAELTGMDGVVRTRFRGGLVDTSHPSYQVSTYAHLLRGFNAYAYETDLTIAPCAYLHNFEDASVLRHPSFEPYLREAPVFLRDDAAALRSFISRHLARGDAGKVMFELDRGRIRPSRLLAEEVSHMLDGNASFRMVDEQKVIFERICAHVGSAPQLLARESPRLHTVREPLVASHEDAGIPEGRRSVIIVHGGPGTGKSVVAVQLLSKFLGEGLLAQYVSKNAAPRAVYESKLTGSVRPTKFRNLFRGSGSFLETPDRAFDVLLVDEAHRLNEKSGLYGNLGDHQVKEIIGAARVAVFFLDEDQRVTLKDVGSRDVILDYAAKAGAMVEEWHLSSQFRCGGSDGYISWLDDLLGIRDGATTIEDVRQSGYLFSVAPSVRSLYDDICAANDKSGSARVVAGYCWNWVSKRDPNAFDLVFPSESMAFKWNLSSDGSLWAVVPTSVSEIGCIHTVQGLEMDTIGVIMGPDLVIRKGRWVARPECRATTDYSIRGWKKLAKVDPQGIAEQLTMIIKNTYRTLMTRGMKRCVVYSTDPETNAFLAGAVAM